MPTSCEAAPSSDALRAGAAMRDITPPLGTHLSGSAMGDHRPAATVLDPLHAKALVLEAQGRRVCIVVLDVTVIMKTYSDAIRRAVSESLQMPPDAVLVCATQTHSAPSLGPFMLDPDFPLEITPQTEYVSGAEHAYGRFAAEQAISAARAAYASMQPAEIGYGRAVVGGLAFNRRGVARDGTIVMPRPAHRVDDPRGATDLCHLEGPTDPEVGVLCLRALNGNTLGMLLHYTCHPVNVFGNRETYTSVSADWPGAWSTQMAAEHGDGCVPIVLNGCCGNINPWDPFDPGLAPDHRRMGRELAEAARRVTDRMDFSRTAVVDWRTQTVGLPYRDIPAARLKEVDQILRVRPGPQLRPDGTISVDPTWFTAASTRSVELARRRAPLLPYEIQVLRLGDAAIVGLPGEPFVEGQLALKTCAQAPFVWPAHMSSQYVGYLPTSEAWDRGGHEARPDVTYWAKLARGSLERIGAVSRELIGGMFTQQPTKASADGPEGE
ncbi:MAG: hypothetical protein HN742_42445 [Lentisphaerae bacterium]|jgi:neutral ceramidase|nr:hypothetical protein [Lentisphaerota bacterium]MBT5605407.1 hypothetical protein [Lentisphaerota bacterium]MBT7062031.1 hypothetical protein [Lentisphaerota bacterium]MBT7848599.1 hypothetical protein [Lentisphaerota bacterium]